jgi:hypothetical protein
MVRQRGLCWQQQQGGLSNNPAQQDSTAQQLSRVSACSPSLPSVCPILALHPRCACCCTERGFVSTVLALLQLKQYRMDEGEPDRVVVAAALLSENTPFAPSQAQRCHVPASQQGSCCLTVGCASMAAVTKRIIRREAHCCRPCKPARRLLTQQPCTVPAPHLADTQSSKGCECRAACMPAQGLCPERPPATPTLPPPSTHTKPHADELWRHLGQLGIEKEDPDAAEPFGGRHPTKILDSMEHGRSGGGRGRGSQRPIVECPHSSASSADTNTHACSVWGHSDCVVHQQDSSCVALVCLSAVDCCPALHCTVFPPAGT